MARTKRQRLGAKRGRPRLEGDREPNGRLSRSGSEPVDRLALETRARHMGISMDDAKDQKAGTFLGYLALIGPRDGLSAAQYEGAQQYLLLRASYLRAIGSPAAIYDPEAVATGIDADAYAAWCKRTRAQYEAVRQDIQEAQNYSRENLWAALQLVVIEDKPMHAMIGPTRLLCNVLAHHFGQSVKNVRAA